MGMKSCHDHYFVRIMFGRVLKDKSIVKNLFGLSSNHLVNTCCS